jgi:ketosteroid isomerase-like protein
MSQRRAEIEGLYRAFNARDIDAVLERLHPDVDWPNGWQGGRVHGREAVRAYWQAQWASIDPGVTPVGMDDTADGVVVTVRQTIRDRAGALLSDGAVRHAYVFEGDLITRMDILASD